MEHSKSLKPTCLVGDTILKSSEDRTSDFLCPICFDIIDEAHVTKCGHTFCFKCISASLERNNRCPKCNFAIEQIFPNFLLNHLIAKHHRALIQKKVESTTTSAEYAEIEALLSQKADFLDHGQIDSLLEKLAKKKQALKESSLFIKNNLLKQFLSMVWNNKKAELNRLNSDLESVEKDKNEACSRLDGQENTTAVASSSFASDISKEIPSSSVEVPVLFNDGSSLEKSRDLEQRKRKLTLYYDDLENCYSQMRVKRQLVSPDDTSSDILNELSETLDKFTQYTELRPLATLTYTSDPFGGSSIVSSIEFDKDNEFFAIAGVTRKIKMFDYNMVVKDTLDMHYPVNEMECSSKISCVSWSSYYKNMMASSDYEGTVTIWDAFMNQKIKVFSEHEKRCWSVDFNKVDTMLVASGSDDSKVKLWSTNMDHSVANLEAKANVCCVKFNPKSRYELAFGCADHCVHYYDLRNPRQPLSVFKGHKKAVSYVKFVNDVELVSASTDSQLKLWHVTSKRESSQLSFKGHINEKNFVGLATDGQFIACGSENNSLYLYYKAFPRHCFTFQFDPARNFDKEKRDDETSDFVSAVCWRPNSNVLVAANSQGIIKILQVV